MIDSTTAFLENNKVLMCFVRVTFQKTSTTNLPVLMKTMELTAKWFLKLYSNQIAISPNFDFAFFKESINKIIALNHGTATAKVFWLLY